MDHIRHVYGGKIRLPTLEESAQAFQQYVEDVQAKRRPNTGELKTVDGRIQVTGALAVMEINAILIQNIHEWNKDKFEFFIQESYPLAWMFPYLRPFGHILKIEKEPLPSPKKDPALWEKIVAEDTAHWDALTADLLSRESFRENTKARQDFSKLRSAIAGVYARRKLVREAEYAWQQAMELCPGASEAAHKLVEFYEVLERYADICEILKNMPDHDDNDHRQEQLERYRGLEREFNKP
jgi:hypothetical protein